MITNQKIDWIKWLDHYVLFTYEMVLGWISFGLILNFNSIDEEIVRFHLAHHRIFVFGGNNSISLSNGVKTD